MNGEVTVKRILILALILAILVLTCAGCARTGDDTPETANDDISGCPSDNNTETAGRNVCTFLIECSSVFSNSDRIDAVLLESLPQDGVIFSGKAVTFSDGESVADVLRRVCADNGIVLETSAASVYGVYVEGIGGLYEFDCGPGSGWLYSVNGEVFNFSSGDYLLSAGDRVEWRYSCDFGDDLAWE